MHLCVEKYKDNRSLFDNHFIIFNETASILDLSFIQGTDSTIQAIFGEAVDWYADGIFSREEALDFFKENVHMALPWLE